MTFVHTAWLAGCRAIKGIVQYFPHLAALINSEFVAQLSMPAFCLQRVSRGTLPPKKEERATVGNKARGTLKIAELPDVATEKGELLILRYRPTKSCSASKGLFALTRFVYNLNGSRKRHARAIQSGAQRLKMWHWEGHRKYA